MLTGQVPLEPRENQGEDLCVSAGEVGAQLSMPYCSQRDLYPRALDSTIATCVKIETFGNLKI